MKLAISNIAWDSSEDVSIRKVLEELQIRAIEVAPTKLSSNPFGCSPDIIRNYKDFWKTAGIDIVAMQSLLFGRPELKLFESEESREALFDYIRGIMILGADLGSSVFVFGSPKNRIKGTLDDTEALAIAVPFFRRLGEIATTLGARFCIEPNPPAYGCDFIVNTEEGIALVKEVAHPGVALHLDAAAMVLNGEDIESAIRNASPYLAHVHISEPFLNEVKEGTVDHSLIKRVLTEVSYEGFVSIEMKDGLSNSNVQTVKRCLELIMKTYFNFGG